MFRIFEFRASSLINVMFQDILNNIATRLSGSTLDLISAVAIGLFGWYFAYAIGSKAANFFSGSKLNQTIKRLGWEEPVARVWRHGSIAKFFGKVVEAWILLFFLMVCAGILQLAQLSQVLSAIVVYFFNIFVAFLILAVAVFLADFSQRTLVANLGKEKFAYSHFLSK